MAYIQRNVPQPNKTHNFSLQRFTGGLNNRGQILDDHQCRDVLNMNFNDSDIMEKRKGTTYFDSLNIGAPVTFIDEYKPYDDLPKLIRASDTEMYVENVSVFPLSGTMSGVNFNGKYYFCDGSGLYVFGMFPQIEYDEDEVTPIENTYQRIVGTPSELYMVMQIVDAPGGYTPLGTEHTQGVSVYDYESGSCWYEPCQLEIEDTSKQGNVVMARPKFIALRDARLYIAGGDLEDDAIYLSDVNNGLYFPASLGLQVSPNSDEIVALIRFNDSIVVGRRNDVFHITGQTNNAELPGTLFTINDVNVHTGFASGGSAVVAHNYLFFLGKDGNAYALNSSLNASGQFATTMLNRDTNFFAPPISRNVEQLKQARSIFYDDKWYIAIGDRVLIYSYLTQGWTMYSNLYATCFYKFENILIWGTDFGSISMPGEDYTDYGNPYIAFWKSKVFDMGDANAFKKFRDFFLVSNTFDQYESDVFLTFELDYMDVNLAIEIDNQMSIWGKSKFGNRFITRNINASPYFTLGRRARGLSFTIRNGYELMGEAETFDKLPVREIKDFHMYRVLDEQQFYWFYNRAWHPLGEADYNQPMMVYQVNGIYEFRGKR